MKKSPARDGLPRPNPLGATARWTAAARAAESARADRLFDDPWAAALAAAWAANRPADMPGMPHNWFVTAQKLG